MNLCIKKEIEYSVGLFRICAVFLEEEAEDDFMLHFKKKGQGISKASVRCVLRPCLICAHEQLEPSQKNGGGCDCVQIIGLAVMQDKECIQIRLITC